MADTFKVLAQVNPLAATLTDAYTVPGATSTVVSSIVVANRSGGTVQYRISVAPGGAVDALQHYLFYDVDLARRSSITFTLGITMAATDKIRVYAQTANLSFNIFGVEVT